MKIIAIILLASAMIAAEGDTFVDAYAFGLSKHTRDDCYYKGDHNFEFNERNYGLGVGYGKVVSKHFDVMALGGVYKDSYNETARFALVGVRGWIGDRKGLHMNLSVNMGHYQGSDFDGIGILPVLGIGYKRVDLCFTGHPETKAPDHKDGVSPGSVGMFLKINVANW